MPDVFDNILKAGTDLGSQYLSKEIADHGKEEPTTRPADAAAAPTVAREKEGLSQNQLLMIGGGLAAAVLLVLVLKK